jgi:hypothetical protein
MKKYVFVIILLASAITHAQNISIELDDGSTISIELEDFNDIVFDNDNLIVSSLGSDCQTAYYSSYSTVKIFFDNVLLGTNENTIENQVILYPNPVSNTLNLKFSQPVNSTATIYNLLGQNVKELELNSQLNQIDVTSLPSGIYILKTENETLKFIKK